MTEHCRLGDSSDLGEQAAANGVRCVNPGKDQVFTIKLSSGAEYRLGGLHVMTKEVRHWHWASIWFSDDPDSDFGADRPNVFGGEEGDRRSGPVRLRRLRWVRLGQLVDR